VKGGIIPGESVISNERKKVDNVILCGIFGNSGV
jgi:hypothetical protein